MVEVPAGEFLMGEDAAGAAEIERECRRYSSDLAKCKTLTNLVTPQHRVRVSGFLIGKYEVTQRQWKAVMGSLPRGNNFRNEFGVEIRGDDLPVVGISWDDVQTFLQRLGKGYRLPSEAEWEYAARAGARTAFAFGPTISPAVVNYNWNIVPGQTVKDGLRSRPMAVGSLGLANAWGLFDMHGNVAEWCEDDWHESYNGAPADGRAWLDSPNRSSHRVIRGGNWIYTALLCRSAIRGAEIPRIYLPFIGFRVVRM